MLFRLLLTFTLSLALASTGASASPQAGNSLPQKKYTLSLYDSSQEHRRQLQSVLQQICDDLEVFLVEDLEGEGTANCGSCSSTSASCTTFEPSVCGDLPCDEFTCVEGSADTVEICFIEATDHEFDISLVFSGTSTSVTARSTEVRRESTRFYTQGVQNIEETVVLLTFSQSLEAPFDYAPDVCAFTFDGVGCQSCEVCEPDELVPEFVPQTLDCTNIFPTFEVDVCTVSVGGEDFFILNATVMREPPSALVSVMREPPSALVSGAGSFFSIATSFAGIIAAAMAVVAW